MHQVEKDEIKKIVGEVVDERMEPFQPMLKIYNQAQGFSNFTIFIMKTLVLIGAAGTVVVALFKWLKH